MGREGVYVHETRKPSHLRDCVGDVKRKLCCGKMSSWLCEFVRVFKEATGACLYFYTHRCGQNKVVVTSFYVSETNHVNLVFIQISVIYINSLKVKMCFCKLKGLMLVPIMSVVKQQLL